MKPNETLLWLHCLPAFGPWKHHPLQKLTWLLDVCKLLHCNHFFRMSDSVAQEDVKRTVNTILRGQVTTTFQKAALDARLGRKNVSLRRERFNGRKATKSWPVLERRMVQGPILRDDSRKSGQLHISCWLEERCLGGWLCINAIVYLLVITVKKLMSNDQKIAHNRHERKTINTAHGFSKLAWNSRDKGPAKARQTNTFLLSKLRSNRFELTCEPMHLQHTHNKGVLARIARREELGEPGSASC